MFCVHQDVKYSEYLDLRPFMSQCQGEAQIYGLYAVLVHSGFSCHAGHYFCYIKVLAVLQTTINPSEYCCCGGKHTFVLMLYINKLIQLR